MGQRNKITTEQFIQKAKAKHGNKYDYSKTEYINMRTKVIITCKIHGEFTQNASSHIHMKRGCPKCARRGTRLTTEEFIKKSKSVHGDQYDYSKVNYKNNYTKVTIICKKHDEFEQTPNDHFKGHGCTACGSIKKSPFAHDQSLYIQKARRVHENKYDYSKTVYKHSQKKIIITCPIHGDFKQTAYQHIQGRGCPECGKSQVSEPLFREVLEKIFVDKFNKEYKFPNIRPEWLVNPETDCRLELDCYNEKLELAFELHGPQHYEPIKHFGGEKRYIKQYRRDLRTRNICHQKGVTLFAIDNRPVSTSVLSTKRKYYEQEILKCLAKVPEKIKVKLLENKVPVQRQSETTIYNT